VNVDIWITCVYLVDNSGSYLQVKVPNCHSQILMKLCTLVKLCKIIDTYFFSLRRSDFKG